MYSANAPGRVTPTPVWLWQNSRRPPLQLRQWPHVTWPSPATRWPTSRPCTPGPSAAISPMNSWPTTIGTGMVACAHASQWWMCRSVPQIEVLRTRIFTSPSPGSGSGTSCIHRPGSALAFTSAFMHTTPISLPTSMNAATAMSMSASLCAADICVRMRALPCGTTGYENAVTYRPSRQQALGHLARHLRVAEHDGDDRVAGTGEREAGGGHALAEPRGVAFELATQFVALLQQVEHRQRGGGDHRRQAVAEQVRPRALAQPLDDLLAAAGVAARCTAERLAQRAGDDVDAVHHAVQFVGALAVSRRRSRRRASRRPSPSRRTARRGRRCAARSAMTPSMLNTPSVAMSR